MENNEPNASRKIGDFYAGFLSADSAFWQSWNLFSMLKKFTTKNENFKNLRFFSKEISLLEALSVHEKNAWTNEVLILQFLQRYHEKLDTEIFSQIAKYRYIRALNRLRVISKEQNFQKLYEKILEIIKKDGAGCFVSF